MNATEEKQWAQEEIIEVIDQLLKNEYNLNWSYQEEITLLKQRNRVAKLFGFKPKRYAEKPDYSR